MDFPILSTLIFLPLISSFFILLSKDKTTNVSSISISLFSSVATFFLSLFLWYSLDINTSEFQFVEEKSWINNFIKFKDECSKTGTTEEALANAEKIGYETGLFVNQLPDGSQKEIVSHSLDAPQTRKSLVKGERSIRFVWRT